MISVMVAACFVVFIGLGNTSLFYYAAKVRDSFQAKTGRGLEVPELLASWLDFGVETAPPSLSATSIWRNAVSEALASQIYTKLNAIFA